MIARSIKEKDKCEICAWRYEGRYSVYDLPPYDELKSLGMGFMRPQEEGNYIVFREDDELIGYINLRDEEKMVSLGIGVKPELCGKGHGKRILEEACRISAEKYPNKPLYLIVREWNRRAIMCYQKAGFERVGERFLLKTPSGEDVFIEMRKAWQG